MNPNVKALWLEALRSERYKQARGGLKYQDDTFCCLGVLCDVKDPDGWESEYGVFRYQGHSGTLPESVCKWAGMSSSKEDEIGNLIRLNDETGASFEDIADWIEANL